MYTSYTCRVPGGASNHIYINVADVDSTIASNSRYVTLAVMIMLGRDRTYLYNVCVRVCCVRVRVRRHKAMYKSRILIFDPKKTY